MRELVYLSQRKLSQFQPARTRGRLLSRITGFGAHAPLSMGEVSVTFAEGTAKSTPDLQTVINELDNRIKAVQWYESNDLQVGDWVQFESVMNLAIVDIHGRQRDSLLLFWEPRVGRGTDASAATLMLHGSVDGLLEGAPKLADPAVNSMSAPQALVQALAQLRNSDDPLNQVQMNIRNWDHALTVIVDRLDLKYPRFMASWLAGYARITGILADGNGTTTYILATPLYVERVSPPAGD